MINKYLKWLYEKSETESVGSFAIDSFPTKASKKPLPVIYSEFIDLDNLKVKRIMIDFDGTIHKYSEGWKDGTIYDPPFPGVKEVINQFKKDGFEIVIFTSRLCQSVHNQELVNKQKEKIEEWLEKYDIEVDGITSEKLPALVYIDDLAISFKGIWNKSIVSEIKNKLGSS